MKKITHVKLKTIPLGSFFVFFLLTFLCSAKVSAQNFCNNEITYWSEDFGTGTTSSSDADVINLSYQANGTMTTSGTYRIINWGDQNPNWHKTPDHTPGDVDGKMLVANAKSGDFYTKSITRAAGYTAGFYSVNFFLMNLNGAGNCGVNTLLPQISINAEYKDANNNWVSFLNSPYVAPATPETNDPVWLHAGGVFTLPTTGSFVVTEVRFTLSDLTVGGCGNDFAIDDLKFTTCPEGGPLPVQFINVSAQKKGTGVNIIWATVTEANNDYFEVEKSTEIGAAWYTVARVKGSGNSSVTKNYAAYDAKPGTGSNYYRIRQVDKDGAARYSATVLYKLTITQTDIAVLENPFTSNITVDFLSDHTQSVNCRLVDNTGRLIISQKMNISKGSSRKFIEAGNLNRGMYIIQMIDENGQVIYKDKLIKK